MKSKIREAQAKDKEGILSVIGSYPFKWDKGIAKKYYSDYFSDRKLFRGDQVYVLELDGKIIGVVGYSLDRYETKNYWLGWFYVHKKYQGGKSAKKLLDHIIGKLRSRGVKKLFVDTSSNKSYQRALIFYMKNGFRIEATIRDYYENGEDQIILSKKIK